MNLKLVYKKGNYHHILSGYVDSDWGGDEGTDMKSTSGFIFELFERCTISWAHNLSGYEWKIQVNNK